MIDQRLEGEEPPRHRKRVKKVHVRSDHRHEYEQVCIDTHAYYYMADRCRVCGRLGDVCLKPSMSKPPSGMRLFEVEDFIELMGMTNLPDDTEVTR